MHQRRTTILTKLTACALFVGAGACGSESDLSVSGNAQNQNLAAECIAENDEPLSMVAHTLNIWPPNHKFHTIDVSDCVSVEHACDPSIGAQFVWASSDEPVDDIGDGHHEPDILVDGCGRVQVRAERQGPKDGRVYKLGVRVVDRDGNVAESTCSIVVDHDQRGVVGADSGEAYRITLDGTDGGLFCDGTQPPLPAPRPTPAPEDAGAPAVDGDAPTTDAGTSTPADAGVEPVGEVGGETEVI